MVRTSTLGCAAATRLCEENRLESIWTFRTSWTFQKSLPPSVRGSCLRSPGLKVYTSSRIRFLRTRFADKARKRDLAGLILHCSVPRTYAGYRRPFKKCYLHSGAPGEIGAQGDRERVNNGFARPAFLTGPVS